MGNIRVYGYLRVSSSLQADKGGFDRQIKVIKGLCKQRKYIIDAVFKEKGVSGTKGELDRPAFQDMIASILVNGINTVIVESLDRLSREYRIQEQILIYLIGKGISLISANTGECVTDAIQQDPMKKALIQMQGIFAELDKAQIVRRLIKGREKVKAEKGKCAGAKHYGEGSQRERNVIKRIGIMRRLKRGATKRMSFDKIANTLNAEGTKTKRGKLWTATGVKNIVDRKKVKTKNT